MPLNFTEHEKPKEQVEFFAINTKARPLELEGEVLPELIAKCGDVKTGRMTVEGVISYLDRNVLIFDRALVRQLFAEADYMVEGSLDARALKAALSARYPKRQLHREWRQLAALLLSVPELVLGEDIKQPKTFTGSFNNDSVWDKPPRELPAVRRRSRPQSKPDLQGWTRTNTQLQAAAQPNGGELSMTGTLLTSEGLKTTLLSVAESSINSMGLQGGDRPSSSFAAQREFSRQALSQRLNSAFGSKPCTPLSADSIMSSGKQSVRAWSAALPPSTIHMPSSALQVLREGVMTTRSSKPEFQRMHTPLGCAEVDLKKTLGQPLDVAIALNRVEPTRPTQILPGADFRQWQDYAASQCRTAPSRWFNDHPAAPAPVKELPYPWC